MRIEKGDIEKTVKEILTDKNYIRYAEEIHRKIGPLENVSVEELLSAILAIMKSRATKTS